MNKIFKDILLYVVEVILATTVWCGLDYLMDASFNLVDNLIVVSVIVLFTKVSGHIVQKNSK